MATNKTESYKKYNDKASKFYSLKFHKEKDNDIIEQLEKQPSKLAYIKQLIREDINREQEKKEYRIKPEYFDRFGSDATTETIIPFSEVKYLAESWKISMEDMQKMIYENTESNVEYYTGDWYLSHI